MAIRFDTNPERTVVVDQTRDEFRSMRLDEGDQFTVTLKIRDRADVLIRQRERDMEKEREFSRRVRTRKMTAAQTQEERLKMESPEDSIQETVDLVVDCVVSWEGIQDQNGVDIPTDRETLRAFLRLCYPFTLCLLNCVINEGSRLAQKREEETGN